MQVRCEHDDGVGKDVGRVGGREVFVLGVGLEESARKFLHQAIDLLSFA